MTEVTMEKLISLAKRRGFVFPGSEIYGGLAGTFDYGPLGIALKNNIKQLWWRMFVEDREDMYGLDAAILMNPKAWEASGHVSGFADPFVECAKCKRRFRADTLAEKYMSENSQLIFESPGISNLGHLFASYDIPCPECENNMKNSAVRQFNMMFKTHAGATEDAASVTYLRPETAGGIFVNFKNVVDTMRPKLPFGIGQIGKAFRNEIAPRDFIFRLRELEQMEVEYFVRPTQWEEAFEAWRVQMIAFMIAVGIDESKVHELEVAPEDLAHYSKRTIDFEFDFPFGRKELYGLAYRTNFDLTAHANASGQSLTIQDEEGKPAIIPHVIEPSLGVDRTILAILASAYVRAGRRTREGCCISALEEQAGTRRESARSLRSAQEDHAADHVGRQRQYRQALPPSGRDRHALLHHYRLRYARRGRG
jgi:glycyl-tRNA synthetase